MYLIVGLGNPGKDYELTRHNTGFLVADRIADRFRIRFEKEICSALIGKGKISDSEVLIAKPLTYMNRSGIAVKCLADHFSLSVEKIIVIYDDIDLPLGGLRIREKGGSGGHKGVASIIRELGTDEFIRIRIGIGRPQSAKVDIVEHVLSPFLPVEKEEIKATIEEAVDAVEWIIQKGVQSAMSKFNNKP
ncbi:MAG: aminoacyl-tRNA hydrolase [Actinobacteria bacterium]|nr:aminoacyl-tRNA hydrolase [Actinomycetota bacterium]